jgi:hypothetical protein
MTYPSSWFTTGDFFVIVPQYESLLVAASQSVRLLFRVIKYIFLLEHIRSLILIEIST